MNRLSRSIFYKLPTIPTRYSAHNFVGFHALNNNFYSRRFIQTAKSNGDNSLIHDHTSTRFSFPELGVASHVFTKFTKAQKIVEPLPIQNFAIPVLLANNKGPAVNANISPFSDVIIQDMTGSGKTLSYVLPILTLVDNFIDETQFIVITPTKELSIQTERVFHTLNRGGSKERRIYNPVKIFRVGGTARGRDTNELQNSQLQDDEEPFEGQEDKHIHRKSPKPDGSANLLGQIQFINKFKPHIIIGTPEALNSIIFHAHKIQRESEANNHNQIFQDRKDKSNKYSRAINLDSVRLIVMDEADGLFLGSSSSDNVMGFLKFRMNKIKNSNRLNSHFNPFRLAFVSASITFRFLNQIHEYLIDPITVTNNGIFNGLPPPSHVLKFDNTHPISNPKGHIDNQSSNTNAIHQLKKRARAERESSFDLNVLDQAAKEDGTTLYNDLQSTQIPNDESDTSTNNLTSSSSMPPLRWLPENITHNLICLPLFDSQSIADAISKLYSALQPRGPILVFLHTSKNFTQIADALNKKNFQVGFLSNSASIEEKAKILSAKHHTVSIILSTDLGARGIDFKGIHHIINISLPSSTVQYLHRAGRIQRAGSNHKDSRIFTILNSESKKVWDEKLIFRSFAKEMYFFYEIVTLEKGKIVSILNKSK